MRIFVIGAGQVGSTIVEALHDEHELTVVDVDSGRLNALSNRFDIRVVEGNGATKSVLEEGGMADADLVIACTSVDEPNIIAAMLARNIAPSARTIVRTSNVEYLELWHERQLDADFVVSSELEAAYAITRTIGVPAARQTDVFADGQVQIVEFDVVAGAHPDVVGKSLRDARIPHNSKVAAIIRTGGPILPAGIETIEVGDRIVVIGSPEAAQEWSGLLTPGGARRVRDVVIYGAGKAGLAVAQMLISQGIGVRLVEASRERARLVAEELPRARVYNAIGLDADFIERERLGSAEAAVFAMREDAKNLYAATLAKLYGVSFTIAIVHDPVSMEVFERAGVDVGVNPRMLTAEEIVRFAHDPRTQQVAMLEGDRYEILDITTRPDSALVGKRFRDLPMTGDLIGAVVRDGKALFPHGDDVLMAGDRAIVFTESERVAEVERTL
jgi:trk system potassium uptake protein TrkA